MCNMDCLNCIHPDCINDELPTEAEMKAQDEYDMDIVTDELKDKARLKGHLTQWLYNHSLKGKEAQKRYANSEKGKEKQKRYANSDKGKEAQCRYAKSKKGKDAQKRYNQSEKCKATQKRYAQSDKGREAQRRQTQKKIASGKNAEYCRRYAMRKKGLAV